MINPGTAAALNWTLLCVILNVLFFSHGVLLLSNVALGTDLGIIGATTVTYASLALLMLVGAWLVPARVVTYAAAIVTCAYTLFVIVVAVHIDVLLRFELIAGIVLVIGFAIVNLVAIRRVQTRATA